MKCLKKNVIKVINSNKMSSGSFVSCRFHQYISTLPDYSTLKVIGGKLGWVLPYSFRRDGFCKS